MAKEKKSQHEFYSIDIASDYGFTDLENLILNIAGGLPMEHLSEDERRMILEKYPNFFDEEKQEDSLDEERMNVR